jgi:hypothetical protein
MADNVGRSATIAEETGLPAFNFFDHSVCRAAPHVVMAQTLDVDALPYTHWDLPGVPA